MKKHKIQKNKDIDLTRKEKIKYNLELIKKGDSNYVGKLEEVDYFSQERDSTTFNSSNCEYGQVVGGTNKVYYIRDLDNKRIGRTNISWLSHNFKTKMEGISHPNAEAMGIRNAGFI